jgi:hypothetical protein
MLPRPPGAPARLSLVPLFIVLLAACAAPQPSGSATQSGGPGTPAPSPSAARSPIAGVDWALAEAVERPPDNIASAPPSEVVHDPNSAGHPGHPVGQAHLQAVAVGGPGLVAVGHVYPGFRAAAWTSTDGRRWARVTDLPAVDDTPLAAVAVSGGRLMAVGRHGSSAAVWASSDGVAWTEAPLPSQPGDQAPSEAIPVQAAAVAGTDATSASPGKADFVAGGWTGAPNAQPSARFWFSSDGSRWTSARVAPATAADARVVAMAASGAGFVAVGQTGPEGSPTGSAAWWSEDGVAWTRIASADLPSDTTPEAVATAPGGGFVAVGSSVARDRAVVWPSMDGRHWRAASDQASFHHYGLKVRMRGVAAGGPGLVAVGMSLFGTQFGSATVWMSADGAVWQLVPDVAVFDGAEMDGVVGTAGGLVAVGTWGAPDQYVPTVWLSPPR